MAHHGMQSCASFKPLWCSAEIKQRCHKIDAQEPACRAILQTLGGCSGVWETALRLQNAAAHEPPLGNSIGGCSCVGRGAIGSTALSRNNASCRCRNRPMASRMSVLRTASRTRSKFWRPCSGDRCHPLDNLRRSERGRVTLSVAGGSRCRGLCVECPLVLRSP